MPARAASNEEVLPAGLLALGSRVRAFVWIERPGRLVIAYRSGCNWQYYELYVTLEKERNPLALPTLGMYLPLSKLFVCFTNMYSTVVQWRKYTSSRI